jgi:general secretion pathway protein I
MSARGSRGFTLIEMVIAFAILGMTLAALYGVFATAAARARRDTHLAEGVLLARSLLARVGTEWPVREGTMQGDWENFTYSVVERPTGDALAASAYTLPTIHVTASVSWKESNGPHDVELSTLKLAPRESP